MVQPFFDALERPDNAKRKVLVEQIKTILAAESMSDKGKIDVIKLLIEGSQL